MEITLLLETDDRRQLRQWLIDNHATAKEVWVPMYRTHRNNDLPQMKYLEIVEEALCFGWIDSTQKGLPDGRRVQRLSPRRKHSHWTQLNIQRCQQLIERDMMTQSGIDAMPHP